MGDVKVEDVTFNRATVSLLDARYEGGRVRARVHFTMADPTSSSPASASVKMPLQKAVALAPLPASASEGCQDENKAGIKAGGVRRPRIGIRSGDPPAFQPKKG